MWGSLRTWARTRRRVPGNPFGAGVRSGDGSNASSSHLAGGGLVRFAAGVAVLKWARLGAGRSCARESYAMFERPTMGRVARIRPEAPGVHGLNLQPVLPWTLRKFRMVWPGVSLLETLPKRQGCPSFGGSSFFGSSPARVYCGARGRYPTNGGIPSNLRRSPAGNHCGARVRGTFPPAV